MSEDALFVLHIMYEKHYQTGGYGGMSLPEIAQRAQELIERFGTIQAAIVDIRDRCNLPQGSVH